MYQPTNVLSATPDYLIGQKSGQPVLVPASSVGGAGSRLPTTEPARARNGLVAGQRFGVNTPETVVFRYNTLTGVAVTGAVSGAITTEINGIPMLKLVGNSTPANNDVTITTNFPPSPLAQYGLVVYIENPSDVNALTVLLANAALTKWGFFTIDIDHLGEAPLRVKSGWFAVSITPENCTLGGAWDWAVDPVEVVRIRTMSMAGKQGVVHIHSFVQAARMMPTWVLGFDDGFATLVSTKQAGIVLGSVTGSFSLKDIMDYYGFKGTVWVTSNPITKGSPGRCSWNDLRALVAAGWGIGIQGHDDPQDDLNSGARLLGPFGYAPRAVSAVNTATETLTTVGHGMPSGNGEYSYRVMFTGTNLPAPLEIDTIYWARRQTADEFSLHTTEAGSFNNTAKINLTTTGTIGNFFWRYGLASNDSGAIQADYQACIDSCVRELGIRPRHLAVNQGAIDEYVSQAAAAVGVKTIRTVFNSRMHNYLPDDANIRPLLYGNAWFSELGNQAQTEAAVDIVCTDGGIGSSYTHRATQSGCVSLAYLCNYLTTRRASGHIDVLTIQEWDARYGVK